MEIAKSNLLQNGRKLRSLFQLSQTQFGEICKLFLQPVFNFFIRYANFSVNLFFEIFQNYSFLFRQFYLFCNIRFFVKTLSNGLFVSKLCINNFIKKLAEVNQSVN